MTIRSRVLAYLTECAQSGANKREIAVALNITTAQVNDALKEHVRERRIFTGASGSYLNRYFASRQARDDYLREPRRFNSAPVPILHPVDKHIPRSVKRGAQCPMLPGSLKLPAMQQTKRTDGKTVITVCQGIKHDPRYQVGPDDEVPSVFRSIRLGATLEQGAEQ